MSEQLSMKVEQVTPVGGQWWSVKFTGAPCPVSFRAEELVAAGIPAEPYPPTPVVITVTRGDQTRSIELSDGAADRWSEMSSPTEYSDPGSIARAEVGAALRELGVGRD